MDQPTAFTSSLPLVDLSAPKLGRTPGKAHKATRSAIRLSYLSAFAKSPFQKRKELEKRREAVRGVEREMKEAKDAEADRKRTALRDRRERQAEKIRSEEARAKMSAKRLQRMKKRQGRSKKIKG